MHETFIPTMKLQFQYGDSLIALEVERDGDCWRVTLPDGAQRRIAVTRRGDDVLQIEETSDAGASIHTLLVPFARQEDGVYFSYEGATYRFEPHTGRTAAHKAKAASGVLTAPMTGIVVEVMVSIGDTVQAYQPLAVIEAMKIMSTLEAPFAGTVTAIHYRAKQQVAHGSPVIEITPLSERKGIDDVPHVGP